MDSVNTVLPPADAASAPRKRVLVITYSQTGQLGAVLERILAPLRQADAGADINIDIHVETLKPQKPFPFPWPILQFFDTFPECVHLDPAPIQPVSLQGDEDFDLVIVSYQVWFLAPSQPVVAFLRSPEAKRLLAGKPVVTVIACRNMWLMAQEKMKDLLANLGARLIDNVVLTDTAPTMATLVTTPRWVLTGKRDAFLGLPPAGVNPAEIARCSRFGWALRDALRDGRERDNLPLLAGLQAVEVDPRLLFSEKAATRSFFVWGKLFRALGRPGSPQRQPLVLIYIVFMLALVLTVVPLSLLVQKLVRPWLASFLARRKAAFELPSGSGTERLPVYER
jgi:hypothetical protein